MVFSFVKEKTMSDPVLAAIISTLGGIIIAFLNRKRK